MTPDGWKLIRLNVSTPGQTYEELYNIYTDPAEIANVRSQYPEIANRLRQLMNSQRTENERFHF